MVRAAALVVLLVLLASCRTVVPAVPLPPGDPRPAALMAHWDAFARSRTGLRGRARLAVDGDVRIRGKQILVLERPASMRIEVLGFLDQTAAVIATDGERFEIFRSADHSYESGDVRPDLLWREAHLALTPEEAVDVLLGGPAPGADLLPARAAQADADWIRMDLVGAGGRVRQRVAFDSAARLRELSTLDADGGVRWRARFDDYAEVDGEPFAHQIVVDEGVAHVEISLRDVELNPALDPGIFRLRVAPEAAERGDDAG